MDIPYTEDAKWFGRRLKKRVSLVFLCCFDAMFTYQMLIIKSLHQIQTLMIDLDSELNRINKL